MRLIPRHRHSRRTRSPQISISEEEISADLHYPASQRRPQSANVVRRIEIR
ncbi:MAG TPA: hypothetical protein VFJ65_00885 [Solirubrobacterales bacterium]|nr:hypothetical protein [Solirubrobacterales bacterium]